VNVTLFQNLRSGYRKYLRRFFWLTFLLVFESTPLYGSPLEEAPSIELKVLVYEGYTSQESIRSFIEKMKAKHFIDVAVKVSYVKNEDELFVAARSRTQDIISPGIDIISEEKYKLLENNLVAPINENIVRNLSSLSMRYQNLQHLTKEGRLYGVPFTSGGYFIFCNADVIKRLLRNLKDFMKADFLLKSKHSRLSIGNYPPHQAYQVALALNLPVAQFSDFDALMATEKFEATFASFHRNACENWAMVDSAESYLKSDYVIGLGSGYQVMRACGKNWKALLPEDGVVVSLDHLMVTKRVKDSKMHETIAMEFVNEALSQKYQAEVILKGNSSMAVRDDARNLLAPQVRTALKYLEEFENYLGPKVYLPPPF
jgi:spermidine/putrescine-binding protein